MKIGPRYKIARRLGIPVFEKTQTQKFAMREQRRAMNVRRRRRPNRSDYGAQLLEKQRARYTYGISERQFRNYVRVALGQGKVDPTQVLFSELERRLDNVVYRMGFAPTRQAARQYVSHGHFTIKGKRVTVPSYKVYEGTEIIVREGSKVNGIFAELSERAANATGATWLKADVKAMSISVVGMPALEATDLQFDIQAVLEFYSR